MTTINAHEASAIARALTDAGQTALAAKWKAEADRLGKLEVTRRKYVDAAGIIGNLGAHVEQACKERGINLGTGASEIGCPPSAMSALRAGKNVSPAVTIKVLKWLGSTE